MIKKNRALEGSLYVHTFRQLLSACVHLSDGGRRQLAVHHRHVHARLLERVTVLQQRRRYDHYLGDFQQPSAKKVAFFFKTNNMVSFYSILHKSKSPKFSPFLLKFFFN
jgi:hypothetical protein